MRGLGRYVRILHLFGDHQSQWTVAEIATALNVPASTVYRTVQDMVSADFLEAGSDARYRLGVSFIEIDRLIRVTDPLYSVGTPLLSDICAQARVPCVAFLARLYNDTVMSVSQAATSDGYVQTSYERGRPRPLTRGATSRIILSHLPTRRLRRLLESEPIPGRSIDDIRAELSVIRKRGYCVARGEVDPGLMGIAAPVFFSDRATLGSISLVARIQDVDTQLEMRLAMLVVATARVLSDELRDADV